MIDPLLLATLLGTLAFAYYREKSFGSTPSAFQSEQIQRALTLASHPQMAPKLGQRLRRLDVRVFSMMAMPAWGYAPHFAMRTIYLSEELLANCETRFVAATLVHEATHTFWPPLLKSTPLGERAAYRAQSQFLWDTGSSGCTDELARRHPDTDSSYFVDLANNFAKYRIASPAVSP